MHRSPSLIILLLALSLTACTPATVVLSRAKVVDQRKPTLTALPTAALIRATAQPPQPTMDSPVPTAAPQITPSAMPDERAGAYCLWPGDNLTVVARAAGVDLSALQAYNPNATEYAGSRILMPPGSLPPADWALPTPAASGPADVPFGQSGYYLGADNRHKRVALTFDIGYVPENRARMEWLREQGISATFFIMGVSVSRHPEVVKDVLANGHTLGSHSWNHLNYQELSLEQINDDLLKTEAAVQAADPQATTRPYFRAPFGAIDVRTADIAHQRGYHIIGWTIDSHDWFENATPEAVYAQVTSQLCPGAIIAMHDASPANTAALPRIVDYLRAEGYELVPLKDLLGF